MMKATRNIQECSCEEYSFLFEYSFYSAPLKNQTTDRWEQKLYTNKVLARGALRRSP